MRREYEKPYAEIISLTTSEELTTEDIIGGSTGVEDDTYFG